MPIKKISKSNKSSSVKSPKAAKPVKSNKSEYVGSSGHGHFLAVLILFAAVSTYAIFSFWDSTNDYIKNMYTSVTGSEGEGVLSDNADVNEEIFTDVFSDHINAEAIKAIYEEGIMKGYDDGSFKPDNTVTRAEFLVVVTNVVDADFGGKSLNNCFTDVQDQWFAPFVCYSKEQGWISGLEDGSYKPNDYIVKAAVLKTAFEALDYAPCEVLEVKPYEDVELDAWYAQYACSAKIGGIIPKAGLFNADKKVTRAELAQIVYNLMEEKGMLDEEADAEVEVEVASEEAVAIE